jgi:hypothetical protein
MPIFRSTALNLPLVTVNPGEFGVWGRNDVDLHVTRIRDGVVALMKVHPTHVAAGYFVSPLDLRDNIDAFLQAAKNTRPGSRLRIDLHYRPVCPGRQRHAQSQPHHLALLMRQVFLDKEPALANHSLLNLCPFEKADTDFSLRHAYGWTETEQGPSYPWALAPDLTANPQPAHRMRNVTLSTPLLIGIDP